MGLDLPEDEEECEYEDNRNYLQVFAVNEIFQNIVENSIISRGGEASRRIKQLPHVSSHERWQQIQRNTIEMIVNKNPNEDFGFKDIEEGVIGGKKKLGNQVFVKICTQKVGSLMYSEYSHAAKVAGHELKGLSAVLSSFRVSGLHVPLMCIIDYKGHRALVMTAVPIGRTTQINTARYQKEFRDEYIGKLKDKKTKLGEKKSEEEKAGKGKEDKTLAKEKNKLQHEMEELQEKIDKEPQRRQQMAKDVEKFISDIAQHLCLRRHTIKDGNETKDIYLPMDLEIHEGYDGRVYALDLSRLMPPESPEFIPAVINGKNTQKPKDEMSYLFRLFRAEFLRKYGVPLCSDAFNIHCEDKLNFEAEREATKFLQTKIIPEAAAIFNDDDQKDAATLKKFMHEHGINLRYLGLFLSHLKRRTKIQGKLLQAEMLARAYTHIINDIMRKAMNEKMCKEKCIDTFRAILSDHESAVMDKELHDKFTSMYLAHNLSYIPSDQLEETKQLFAITNAPYWGEIMRANKIMILHRVSEMTGAKWDKDILQKIEVGEKINLHASAEKLKFSHVEKHIDIQPTPEGYRAQRNYPKAIACYKMEMRLRKQILGPHHLRVAISLIYLAEACVELNTEAAHMEAESYFQKAIEIYKLNLDKGKHVELDYAAALERRAKHLLRFNCIGIEASEIDAMLAKSLSIKQRLNDVNEIAKTLNLQAWADYRKGEYQKAHDKYVQCIKELKGAAQTTSLAMAHSNLSLVALKLERVGNAVRMCKLAKRLITKDASSSAKEKDASSSAKDTPGTNLSARDKANLAAVEDNLGKIMEFIDSNPKFADDLKKSTKATKQSPQRDSDAPKQAQASKYRGKARKSFESALEYRQDLFGDEHYLTTFSLDHVAQILLKNEERRRSFEQYALALPALRKCLGRNHASVGILLHNIATWLAHQKNYQRARSAQEEAAYILYIAFGPNHDLTQRAINALRAYSDVHQEIPQPMNHEGVLAPDEPDPACFIAPYQEENQPEISVETKDFKTLVELISIRPEEIDYALPEELVKLCGSMVQQLEEELPKWKNKESKKVAQDQDESDVTVQRRPSCWDAELSRASAAPTQRRNSFASLSMGKITLKPKESFQLQEEDSLLLHSIQPPDARVISAGAHGRDVGSLQVDSLPHGVTTAPLDPAKQPPAPFIPAHDPSALPKGTIAPVVTATPSLSSSVPVVTATPSLLSIESVSEQLDPWLKLLTPTEWKEIVHLTREYIFNRRLISAIKPVPYAEDID